MVSSSSADLADSNTLNRVAENERHFHTIQAGVRGFASTWVLAAFAGIAALLQQSTNVTWLLRPVALVIVICVMANCGLCALWIIDQLVYQRLFNTNYMAGLRLEKRFPAIPPVRAIQAFTTRGKSIALWVKFFYAGPLFAFAIIALVAATVLNARGPIDLTHIAMAVVALLALAPLAWVLYQAREVSFFRLAASLSGDLSTLLREETCRAIIESHLDSLNAVNPAAKTTRDVADESEARPNRALEPQR